MTTVDTHRAATGVDIPTALAHLTAAGYPADALTAAGVDITDPQALAKEIGELLRSLLAEDILTTRDLAVAALLQFAGEALDSDEDTARRAALADDMARFLAYQYGLTTVRPLPRAAVE